MMLYKHSSIIATIIDTILRNLQGITLRLAPLSSLSASLPLPVTESSNTEITVDVI